MNGVTSYASGGGNRRGGRIGSLDGLRALSIAAVLLYHGGVAWAGGGFVGVEVFFVLSGFLITSLLVGEWNRSGGIALGRFWVRRARRLLPALFAMVTVVGVVYATTLHDAQIPGLQGDGLAALLYIANWHELVSGAGYFAANGPVSPLTHTWSLAVEEQFYLAWPLIVLAVLSVSRRRRFSARRGLRLLLFACVLGVLGSALDSVLQLHGRGGLDRVYYGTDTRAAGLLMGSALAVVLALRELEPATARSVPAHPRRSAFVASAISLAALASVLAAIHWAGATAFWLYPYGLLGVDIAVLILIATCVLVPAAIVTRAFSLRPLRGIGVISYGIYLWHFPLFVWLTTASTGSSGLSLLAFRVLVTLAVSVFSYVVIERSVRQRLIPNLVTYVLSPLAAAAAVGSLVFASAVQASALRSAIVAPPFHARSLAGDQPPCSVGVTDTPAYGVLPLDPATAALDEPAWLVGHRLRWHGSGRLQFRTCPPKRVLLIGDSIAFTLGVGLMENEQEYGVEVADAAILGCAFNNQGQLNSRGKWEDQYAGCPEALQEWATDEARFHAQAVVVELGYRDEFDWRWNGRVVHIGQPGFDSFVRNRIQQYVDVLGRNGVPVVFVTVPWSDPPALADGSPAPASSPARHAWIDGQLEAVAAGSPAHVGLVDIDSVISPGHHYTATIDGKLCRFDGVHLTVFCSQLLQSSVLTEARHMIDENGGR